VTPLPPVHIYVPGSRPDLFQSPALFLSASVPYKRDGLTAPAEIARNDRYIQAAQPALIREAVAHLCRFTFQRDINLIFGAHPSIAPMVLEAARRFGADSGRKRVIVFQSTYFESKRIPRETLALSNWQYGELLWTDQQTLRGQPDKKQSLRHMREVMVQSPKLIGAIFIGGMEGVEEESTLFTRHQPGKPSYAIGSTGSAAQELLSNSPDAFSGNHRTIRASDLMTLKSYPLLMKRLFSDLGKP
jgi:hypothetical protein